MAEDIKSDSRREEEFTWYYSERESVLKNVIETEKNYDTLIVSLATLGITSSFTILKELVAFDSSRGYVIISWIFFGICLLSALLDRLLSFESNRRWHNTLDDAFYHWQQGAQLQVCKTYDTLVLPKWLPFAKWIGFGTLILGILFLMFASVAGSKSQMPSKPTPVIVNQYNAIQPSGVKP